MNRAETLEILRAFKRESGEKYGILELGLFGSLARDTAGEDSDVDICVKTRTPNPFVLVHLKEDLEARFHRRVDIVRMRDRMNPFLRARIEQDGIYV